MDARSLSDFFSHNGYGCPLPLQAATAAAAADGSAVCFFSWGLTCLAAWVKNEFDADAVGRNSPSGPKQPLNTNLHTGPKQPLSTNLHTGPKQPLSPRASGTSCFYFC